MPNPMVNNVGDQPIERYNVAPTMHVALLHLEDDTLVADPVRWGWRPHWAKWQTSFPCAADEKSLP